jgi:crossover junction endodeoxyribonuclease RuvC
MLILGIDPGTATSGWGILQVSNKVCEVIDYGLIETSKDGSPSKRLLSIFNQLSKIIDDHKPDIMAIEKLFFATNAKTAIRVGQAQGVILHSAAAYDLEVFEYAPGTIKKMITGDGRADKKMMQKSIRKHLGNGIKSRPKKRTHFDNEADALAVALCHVFSIRPPALKASGPEGGDKYV